MPKLHYEQKNIFNGWIPTIRWDALLTVEVWHNVCVGCDLTGYLTMSRGRSTYSNFSVVFDPGCGCVSAVGREAGSDGGRWWDRARTWVLWYVVVGVWCIVVGLRSSVTRVDFSAHYVLHGSLAGSTYQVGRVCV